MRTGVPASGLHHGAPHRRARVRELHPPEGGWTSRPGSDRVPRRAGQQHRDGHRDGGAHPRGWWGVGRTRLVRHRARNDGDARAERRAPRAPRAGRAPLGTSPLPRAPGRRRGLRRLARQESDRHGRSRAAAPLTVLVALGVELRGSLRGPRGPRRDGTAVPRRMGAVRSQPPRRSGVERVGGRLGGLPRRARSRQLGSRGERSAGREPGEHLGQRADRGPSGASPPPGQDHGGHGDGPGGHRLCRAPCREVVALLQRPASRPGRRSAGRRGPGQLAGDQS
jgi:hypothetical protein